MMNGHPQAHVDMVYDGPALADGSMNVRDLAPAMMAVGGFFESANRISNGGRASISVNVRATSAGSFHIIFEVIQNVEAAGVLEADIGEFPYHSQCTKGIATGWSWSRRWHCVANQVASRP